MTDALLHERATAEARAFNEGLEIAALIVRGDGIGQDVLELAAALRAMKRPLDGAEPMLSADARLALLVRTLRWVASASGPHVLPGLLQALRIADPEHDAHEDESRVELVRAFRLLAGSAEAVRRHIEAPLRAQLAGDLAPEAAAAAEQLCRIYFDIAVEAFGEEEVRRRRDAAIDLARGSHAGAVGVTSDQGDPDR